MVLGFTLKKTSSSSVAFLTDTVSTAAASPLRASDPDELMITTKCVQLKVIWAAEPIRAPLQCANLFNCSWARIARNSSENPDKLPAGFTGRPSWAQSLFECSHPSIYQMAYPDANPIQRIAIDDYEFAATASGTFTRYIIVIVLKGKEWSVKRRYSNFLDLHM